MEVKDIINSLNKELLFPNEQFVNITDLQVPGVCDNYQVSNFGRVYSKYSRRFKELSIMENGYYGVQLQLKSGKSRFVRVNRLVIISFKYFPGCEDISKFICNHKDGNKLNNHIDNLEWMTHSENNYHAYSTGLHSVGEENSCSKITNIEAIQICELIQSGKYTCKEIASIVGGNSNERIIRAIKNGYSWKHISKDYNFDRKNARQVFSEEDVHKLCSYFQNCAIIPGTISEHCRYALQYFGYPVNEKNIDTLRKIFKGRYYKNIVSQYDFNQL